MGGSLGTTEMTDAIIAALPSMSTDTSIFDTHAHIGTARHSGRSCIQPDDLLRDMDRHAVERALVIPFPVVENYRAEHDEIGAAVMEHPDRLWAPPAWIRTSRRPCFAMKSGAAASGMVFARSSCSRNITD